jgi:hypothetical protein
MPKQICSSADEGYFESFDYGESRKRTTTTTVGLGYHYLAGLAVDSACNQRKLIDKEMD